MEEVKLVSVAEFAKLAGLRKEAIYRLAGSGQLRGTVKLGRTIRIDVARALASESINPEPRPAA